MTREVFPVVPELEGLYYYDSAPDWVVVAREGERLIGLRPVVVRELELAGARVRMTQPAYARGAPWVERMELGGEVFVGVGAF